MNVSQFLMRIDELKEQHNFVPEDTAFGMEHWTFVEDLLAPGVAMKYDGMTLDRTSAGPWLGGCSRQQCNNRACGMHILFRFIEINSNLFTVFIYIYILAYVYT